MKVQFCGAARTVTGSAHLITLNNGYKILLDCGLYQGNDKEMNYFNKNWYFKPNEIDCVILSHAHIDHSGRLPKLVKDGFEGKIFSTHATKSLCSIMLLDSAFIQERDAEWYNKKMSKKKKRFQRKEPLYQTKDVPPCMNQFVGLGYDRWLRINKHVEVLFRDAGHILGSASVTLRITDGGESVLFGFTGDIGRPDRPILRDPYLMKAVDYLICESTYGDRLHSTGPEESDKLLQVIKDTCIKKKGKLIIPAFSVGRTQEIVYMLDKMENAGMLPRIPVYVDSPLAVNATVIFNSHPECFDKDLVDYMGKDPNPFGFNNLTYIKDVEVSKSLNDNQDPCIIISAAGMMTAGRVVHHIFNNIDKRKNTLLIVGYCAPNTLGGILRSGVSKVKMFGEWKNVNADVVIMDSFSAHGDRNEMGDFLSNQTKLKKLFLVHGEYDTQRNFQAYLEGRGFANVEIPDLDETYKL
ncbi:MAG: MBL fold metallo-hydrolase [Bacteroidia bacterium]|nr:MBL fold metallo-hydrolase [Bacteroidia bacterium]